MRLNEVASCFHAYFADAHHACAQAADPTRLAMCDLQGPFQGRLLSNIMRWCSVPCLCMLWARIRSSPKTATRTVVDASWVGSALMIPGQAQTDIGRVLWLAKLLQRAGSANSMKCLQTLRLTAGWGCMHVFGENPIPCVQVESRRNNAVAPGRCRQHSSLL